MRGCATRPVSGGCRSRDYRRSRAVYLDVNRPENIRAAFETLGLGADDVDLIVVSDAEEILGIGD